VQKQKNSIPVQQNKNMAVKIQMVRFSIATGLLSASQWYAQPFEAGMPGATKNNSDHHKWPDNIGT